MSRFSLTFPLVACCFLRLASSADPAGAQAVSVHGFGQYHGLSPAARTLPPLKAQRVAPRTIRLRHKHPVPSGVNPTPPFDSSVQKTFKTAVSTTAGVNVLGLGLGFPDFTVSVAPPDTNAAVGTTQVVETVNLSMAVFGKTTGAPLSGPTDLSALFTGVDNNCETGSLSDPVVLFDKITDPTHPRWVITFLAATAFDPSPIGPFLQCFAVSTTSDATGAYHRYAFDLTGLGGLNDYGKLGIWRDAYYMSFNEFDAAGNFLGASPCAFQSSAMIAGSPAAIVCFPPIPAEDSLLPADSDGANLPSAGEPEFFLGTLDGSSHFNLWKFRVDFATPSSSTFTGPVPLTTAPYAEACGGGECIRQPSGGESLDSLGDRLMFRAAYRNFGDHESIVVSHSVAVGTHTGIRWYEIRNPNSAPSIFQQGTFAPDGKFRWMPSIAMDHVGDIAVGYSVSSELVRPSIRYTGRTPSQPLGTMSSEASIVAGTGVQHNTFHRWGDYSSMSVDPSDDCTFWYAQEYIKTPGSFMWSTRLASFKFPGCHSP
jgi:hypothetical protein